MNRRRLLITLGAAATGSSAAVGTGAFTSASANRTVSVSVAGDANAFLTMKPSPGSNGAYADIDAGRLAVRLDESGENTLGNGVNDDAVTEFSDVFRIRNSGTSPVYLYVEDRSEAVTFEAEKVGKSRVHDSPPSILTLSEVVNIEGGENAVYVPVGDSIAVHLHVDTTGDSTPDSLLRNITVRAQSTVPRDSSFARDRFDWPR